MASYAGLHFEPYSEGDDRFRETYATFTSQLYQNASTGHWRFEPVPPPEILDLYYNGTFRRSVEQPSPEREFRPEIVEICRNVKSYVTAVSGLSDGFTLHDIGCGFGAGVWGFQQVGVKATGNEANREWIELANPYCHHGLYADPLKNVLERLGYPIDVFFTSHVMEHVPDPLADLALVSKYMSDRGVAYINVPNGIAEIVKVKGRRDGVDYNNFPMHLNFFTPKSMREMLLYVGLEVVEMQTRPLHEMPYRANDPNWAGECATSLMGGELFVLATKKSNPSVKRRDGLDIRIDRAHIDFNAGRKAMDYLRTKNSSMQL